MAKTEIFTLGLDGTQYLSVAKKLQTSIVELTKEQKKMRGTTKETSKAFVQNASDLKELKANYNNAIKGNIEYNNQAKATATLTKEVNTALKREAVTINEANQQTTRLNKVKKSLNVNNKEEKVLLDSINKRIDKNTEFVKDNSSSIEKQKMNIGNYSSALGGLHPMLGKLASGLEASKGGLDSGASGFKKFNTVLKFSIIGIIVTAVMLLIKGLMKMQPVIDKVSEVFAGMNAVLDVTIGFFSSVISLVTDVVTGQKSLSEAWKEGTELAGNLGQAMKDAYEEGAAIQNLIKDNERLARTTSMRIGNLEVEAERLKAISDDNTKSFQERESALKKSMSIERTIASERLTLAKNQMSAVLRANNLAAKSNALTDEQKNNLVSAINEVNTARKESQAVLMTNMKEENMLKQDRLEKDLDILIDGFDNVKKLNDKIIDSDKTTLSEKARLIAETQSLSNQSFEKQVSTLQKLTTENINADDLLKESNATLLNEKIRALGLSEIGETRLLEVIRERRIVESETAEQTKELAAQVIEKTIEGADRELEIYKRTHQRKKEEDTFFTQEKADAEKLRLENELAEEEKLFQEKLALQPEKEQELTDAIQLVRDENRIAQDELTLERDEALKEKKVIDLENQRAIDDENFNNKFALETERLERQRLLEVENAKKTGASVELINKKYAAKQKKIDGESNTAKLKMLADTLGSVAELLGKESALGKAAAISQALINTYLGISAGVKLGYPQAIPAVAAAAVTGFGAVKNIVSTKAEKGAAFGILDGKRHSQGGEDIHIGGQLVGEMEGGEMFGVMSRQATSKFLQFNNENTDGVSSDNGYFENGGAISSLSSASAISNVSKGTDMNAFIDKINGIKVVNNVNDTSNLINDNLEVENVANL